VKRHLIERLIAFSEWRIKRANQRAYSWRLFRAELIRRYGVEGNSLTR
jgi:hypothetical protein